MKSMFYNCSNLISLNLTIFNTFNVTNMKGMFQYGKFISLNLSNFDTSNVKDMSYISGVIRI